MDILRGNAGVLNAVCALVKHAYMYKRRHGIFPNHSYMMLAFGIKYEFADHVLNVAALVDARQ